MGVYTFGCMQWKIRLTETKSPDWLEHTNRWHVVFWENCHELVIREYFSFFNIWYTTDNHNKCSFWEWKLLLWHSGQVFSNNWKVKGMSCLYYLRFIRQEGARKMLNACVSLSLLFLQVEKVPLRGRRDGKNNRNPTEFTKFIRKWTYEA